MVAHAWDSSVFTSESSDIICHSHGFPINEIDEYTDLLIFSKSEIKE